MGGSRSKGGFDQTRRHQRLVSAVAGLDLATASSHYLADTLFLSIPAFLTPPLCSPLLPPLPPDPANPPLPRLPDEVVRPWPGSSIPI